MIRIAQILLTLVTIQTGLIPLLADLNPSHVFHEGWLTHARFHTSWAITIGAGLAIYVLVCAPAQDRALRLRYASAPGCIFLGAFFVAFFFIDGFFGALVNVDDPVQFFGFDGNVFTFSIASVVQAVGTIAALRASNN